MSIPSIPDNSRSTIASMCSWLCSTVWPLVLVAQSVAQEGRDVGVFGREQVQNPARKVALCVGVDDYERLRDLTRAEKDADDVATELESLGFLVTRMRMAGKPGEPKPYTGGAILNQVERVLKHAEPSGIVVFYYSGHGFQGRDGKNYLCPYGTDRAQLEVTGLDLAEVQKRLVASGVKRRLLIVDMCRNQPGKDPGDEPFTLQQFEKAQGTGLLFSAAPGSLSHEPEGAIRDERGTLIENGLFTHYLLRGLRGEADDGRLARRDGFVTFQEVANFVSDGLARLAMQRADLDQVPWRNWDGTADDVLLRVLPAPSPTPAPVASQPRPEEPARPASAVAQPEAPNSVSDWADVLRADPDCGGGHRRCGAREDRSGRLAVAGAGQEERGGVAAGAEG